MYEHHIDDMLEALAKKSLITDRSEAKKALQEYWEDKIAITWNAEDVIGYAKIHKKVVTEEQARDILQTMLQKHDCEYGITWDTIRENLP